MSHHHHHHAHCCCAPDIRDCRICNVRYCASCGHEWPIYWAPRPPAVPWYLRPTPWPMPQPWWPTYAVGARHAH